MVTGIRTEGRRIGRAFLAGLALVFVGLSSAAATPTAYLRANRACTIQAEGSSSQTYLLSEPVTANDGGTWYGSDRLFVTEGLTLGASVTGYSTSWYSYAGDIDSHQNGPSAATALMGKGEKLEVGAALMANLSYAVSGTSSNSLFYAVFTPIAYAVSYDLKGGTAGVSQPTAATYDQSFTVSAPTRTGYAFAGWSVNGRTYFNGEAEDVTFVNLTTVAGGAVMLTAMWTPCRYGLALEVNEGVEVIFYQTSADSAWKQTTQSMTVQVDYGAEWSAYAKTAYGYVLTGAGSSAEVPQKGTMGQAGASFGPLPAKRTYRLTVVKDPAEGGTVTPNDQQYYYRTIVTLQATVKEGWDFAGWSDGSSDPTHDIVVLCDTNIVARFTRKSYAVTYRVRTADGSWRDIVQTVCYGDKPVVPTTADYNCATGYAFKGWGEYTGGEIKETTIIKAEYEPIKYTVKYVGNGETSGEMANQTLTYDTEEPLKPLNFARTGFSFAKWALDPDGETEVPYVDKTAGTVRNLASVQGAVVTLYAVWEPIRYTIRFDKNGGSGSMDDLEVGYADIVELPSCKFANETHDFEGWVDAQEHSFTNGETVTRLANENGAIVTLMAQWDDVASVTFNGNGGTLNGGEGPQTYAQAFARDVEAVLIPNEFVRAGYTFTGWDTDAVGTNVVYADQAVVTNPPFGATTGLYAVWTANKCHVIFDANGGSTNTFHLPMKPAVMSYGEPTNVPCTFAPPGVEDWKFVGWSNQLSGVVYAGTVVSNLTTFANDHVRLFAIWTADLGSRSAALNCDNLRFTVNKESGWTPQNGGTQESFLTNGVDSAEAFQLSAEVVGKGILSFDWRASALGDAFKMDYSDVLLAQRRSDTKLSIYNGDNPVTNLTGSTDNDWESVVCRFDDVIDEWTLKFEHKPDLGLDSTKVNTIALYPCMLRNVKWTPDPVETKTVTFELGKGTRISGGEAIQQVAVGGEALEPTVCPAAGDVFVGWDKTNEWKNVAADVTATAKYVRKAYAITYLNTRGEANPNPATFTADDKIDFTALDADGFVGWSPAGIAAGTTSNVVATALWDAKDVCTVTYRAGEHGDLAKSPTNEQTVAKGKNAFWPEVTAHAGWLFTGWDNSTDAVSEDIVATAQYVPVEYTITYANLKGVSHRNPLTYKVTDSTIVFEPPDNADPRMKFQSWTPAQIEGGSTGNTNVVANWAFPVKFDLGSHLTRTGGGALEQDVNEGEDAVEPSVTPEAGYRFVGWDGSFSNVTAAATVVAQVERVRHAVVIDGVAFDVGEGETVTREVAAERTDGGTNLVCVGWTGTGDVPAAGSSNRVTFVVTQPSSLKWLYATNYLVRVTAGEGGAATLRDASGNDVGAEGWFAAGTNLTAVATAADGWAFTNWVDAATGAACGTDAALALAVTAARSVSAVFESVSGPGPGPGPVVPVVTNLAVGAWVFTPEVSTIDASIRQGVFVLWPVKVPDGATVKVSKLPTGIKYAKKTVTDKKRGIVIPAGTIYGAATSAKTYGTKLTVTTATGKPVYVLNLTVIAMATDFIGGYVGGSMTNSLGSATVKLAKTGKVSGKWISEGKTWTLSSPSLDGFDVTNGIYGAMMTAKCKKELKTLPVEFGALKVDAGFANGTGTVAYATCDLFDAYYTNWKKAEPWKSLAKMLKKSTFETLRPDAYLSAKVGSYGVVTVKGEFNVGLEKPYKKSAKGTLVPLGEDRFGLFLYYPPKKNKFAGCAVELVLKWDGGGLQVEREWFKAGAEQ